MKYNPEKIVITNGYYEEIASKILVSLSPREKDVFKLYIGGFSLKEISKILKLNIKTVYNVIGRIKEKSRTIIENY